MCNTAKTFEQAGIPVVMIGSENIRELTMTYLNSIGMPDIRLIMPPSMTSHEMSKNYAPTIIPEIVPALTQPLTNEEKRASKLKGDEFSPVCITGSWDECQDYFQGGPDWNAQFTTEPPPARLTSGIPVVLPTEKEVSWMLTGTSHDPDEVLSPTPLPDRHNEFTVKTVAINAVMAGCKPEYMPVLLATAEMMTKFVKGKPQLLLGVVSGPIANELDMSNTRIDGEGYRSNYSMRHAMSLIGLNAIGAWSKHGQDGHFGRGFFFRFDNFFFGLSFFGLGFGRFFRFSFFGHRKSSNHLTILRTLLGES